MAITAKERLEIATDRRRWLVDEVVFRAEQAQSEPRQQCQCGFKIRGSNHEQGVHHKKRHPKLRRDGK